MDEGAVWADVYIEPSPPREHKAVKKFCALSVNQRLKNILKNSVNQCESVSKDKNGQFELTTHPAEEPVVPLVHACPGFS